LCKDVFEGIDVSVASHVIYSNLMVSLPADVQDRFDKIFDAVKRAHRFVLCENEWYERNFSFGQVRWWHGKSRVRFSDLLGPFRLNVNCYAQTIEMAGYEKLENYLVPGVGLFY